MARVLITGGAGYVGSHRAKALAAAGHKCIVFDNLLFGHRGFVRWGELIEGDIRDGAALDAAFSTNRIDAVVHFAALASVGESVTTPGCYYDVNVHGTRVMVRPVDDDADDVATANDPLSQSLNALGLDDLADPLA